jgi:hypothetical protein
MSTQFPEIKASIKLPAVLAITEVIDAGPCDGGYGSAQCPHCGAEGRYVIKFLCEDGVQRGAMQGCFKLFPGSTSPVARIIGEAFKRQRDLKPGQKLATWWADMIAACEALKTADEPSPKPRAVEAFLAAVNGAERRRQDWLRRKGFKRGRR